MFKAEENSEEDLLIESGKSSGALKTIGEVADLLDVQQHILRFWETKFPIVNPIKSRSRRYYTNKDVAALKKIKHMLYQECYNIKGVQKYFEEKGDNAIEPHFYGISEYEDTLSRNDSLKLIIQKLESLQEKLSTI